jgi:hypothetical protein
VTAGVVGKVGGMLVEWCGVVWCRLTRRVVGVIGDD